MWHDHHNKNTFYNVCDKRKFSTLYIILNVHVINVLHVDMVCLNRFFNFSEEALICIMTLSTCISIHNGGFSNIYL